MKKINLYFFILFSLPLIAGEGIVVVLEAPLLREPNLESKVMQLVRKGQKIYIHNKHFLQDLSKQKLYTVEDLKKIDWKEENFHSNFYLTIDRSGNDAYIPKEYIKLITKDNREFTKSITPFAPDPTDYRAEEPLPEGYPIVRKQSYRGQISLGTGPDIKTSYLYPRTILKEKYSSRRGAYISYGRKAAWDKYDRFYFGGVFHIWTSQAQFTLFDFTETKEARGQLGLGPYIAYDTWRNRDYQITLQGTLTLNWNRVIVSQTADDESFEERSFKGFSFSPRLGSFFQIKNIIPKVDFLSGIDLQLYLPHTLKSTTPIEIPDLWQKLNSQNDVFSVPFTAHWTLFIGFQSHY